MSNMLLKRNLLENITILSSCGTFICILLNYVTNISLLTGIWLPLYLLALFVVSVFGSFKFIKWLLSLNKPLTCDVDNLVKEYPYLSFLKRVLPERKPREKIEIKEYDTNELSVISTVLERKLVSSWYVPYISQEISFPFACKQMLDQMIGKAFQICNNIDSKEVFVDITTILTTHLKEYQKALKRQQKSPNTPIPSLYKKSHPISEENKKYTSIDHSTNILRVIIKELIPWELWDTPHSELLVRILAKKLDNYITTTLADPEWINDRLITYLTGQEYVDPNKTEVTKPEVETKEVPDTSKTDNSKEEGVKEKPNEVVIDEPVNKIEMEDVNSSPVLRQKRGRQGRNEVKIYDRIIEGSVKTWETDMDLQCISLGQDLLASLDGEITLSRLWGHEDETSPERRAKSPQPLWFGEEDLDLELDPKDSKKEQSPKPIEAKDIFKDIQTTVNQAKAKLGELQLRQEHEETRKENQSPKATEVILKDIQSTVREAKTKIGDLQVGQLEDDTDEAAGMMEGLLDFGIAGLKKGLRFTGLSDDAHAQEKLPSHHHQYHQPQPQRDRGDKSPGESTLKIATYEHNTNNHAKEDLGNGVPHLIKQQRVTSQDSTSSIPRAIPPTVGVGVGVPRAYIPLSESPEPVYEEAADLSTSIAKLRCLLRQRAETMPKSDDNIWWEGAEETRGRTQAHPSSRPVDTATLADEYDMTMDRNTSPNQTSNNMQRLDKLFHRTVTGVFNSLKTAVGGDEEALLTAPRDTDTEWAYVTANMELSLGVAAGRVACGVRAARVDTAFDTLQLPRPPPPPPPPHPPEDLEEWVSVEARAWGASGAAAAAVGAVSAHAAHTALTVLLADIVEEMITSWLCGVGVWVREQVFQQFRQEQEGDPPAPAPALSCRRPFVQEETVAIIVDKLPALALALRVAVGREGLSVAVRGAVASAAHADLNRDLAYRLLDLLALRFHASARYGYTNTNTNINTNTNTADDTA